MGCALSKWSKDNVVVIGEVRESKPQASSSLRETADATAEEPELPTRGRKIGSIIEDCNSRLSAHGAEEVLEERLGSKHGFALVKGASRYNKGDDFDLIVLGAGPAGVRAAVEAAGRGVRVGLIDVKASITGTPTGAHSKCLREAAVLGASSWEEVRAVADRAMKAARAATSRQLRQFLIEVLTGTGAITSEKSLEFTPKDETQEKRTLTFGALIVATGSKANRFPPVAFELHGVYDSDTIQQIDRMPQRMVIQGAGIIGLEYAVIFKKLGCPSVIIVDLFDKVAPMLDVDLQTACKRTLEENGIQIIFNTKIEKTEAMEGSTHSSPKVAVSLEGGQVLECDTLLSACGRSGASKGIGLEVLEPLGCKVGRGAFVQVDQNSWTGVGNIYACGDIAGGNLATIGQAQAVRAIRKCYGSGMVLNEKGMGAKPFGVWTVPEIAWAGITEDTAKSQGLDFGTVKVDFSRTVRGCVSGEEGFLKLIYAQQGGKVVGVHMFGEQSCDLINFGAEVVNSDLTIYDLLQFVFPAVTYHELYHLAAFEAKLRIMRKGAKSLEAATAWQRVEVALKKGCEESGKTIQEALSTAFRYFDLDSSGLISPEELKRALRGFNLNLTDEQICEMVFEATGAEDEEDIDYETFLGMFGVAKAHDEETAQGDPQGDKTGLG